ncbi:MAG: SGNH/GDSL hydrolase family protein [Verrucomicrobiota bacterium JB023]|nr:SGNH/GDSL hydrolase family protein [Verrucomicrobiota bacterium JB023]
MKTTLSLILAGALAASATELITLGDSLTFAYEATFANEAEIPFDGPIGDGFDPDEVKNWAEILQQLRGSEFDLGERDTISASISFFTITSFFRQERNWAIPGLKLNPLRRFITGEATILTLLAESEEFSNYAELIENTDFNEAEDFAVGDLNDQIENSDGRLVLFMGGNDVDAIYGTLYDGGSAGTFITDFLADTAAVLTHIQMLNPDLPIALVNVPHVGITPNVKEVYPPDAVKTARVTDFMEELNEGLEDLANSRGIAYADIFTPTRFLLDADPLSVYGVPFTNAATEAGATDDDLEFVWLSGDLAQGFHPSTSAQALIANEIIAAFNDKYQATIPALTTNEVLVDLLQREEQEVDMNFTSWAASYSLAGLDAEDDQDGDGIPAALEFGLGLNPLYADRFTLDYSLTPEQLTVTYPLRLPSSSHVTVTPQFTDNLADGFQPFDPLPTIGEDQLFRASLPRESPRAFLRVSATLEP